MKQAMLIIGLLSLALIAGCSSDGNTLSFIGNGDYLPINKTCASNHECAKFVSDQGGDGSPSRCIQNQCAYPIDLEPPNRGD